MTPRLTHFAINTDDVELTQAFYGSVFGWEFQEYGPPGFVQIMDDVSRPPMGAIQQRRQLLHDEPTRGFECTFSVDDVDVTRERIVTAGGKILMGQVHHLGRGAPHRVPRPRRQPRSRHGVQLVGGIARAAHPDPHRKRSTALQREQL